jgi:hypothetical protein
LFLCKALNHVVIPAGLITDAIYLILRLVLRSNSISSSVAVAIEVKNPQPAVVRAMRDVIAH